MGFLSHHSAAPGYTLSHPLCNGLSPRVHSLAHLFNHHEHEHAVWVRPWLPSDNKTQYFSNIDQIGHRFSPNDDIAFSDSEADDDAPIRQRSPNDLGEVTADDVAPMDMDMSVDSASSPSPPSAPLNHAGVTHPNSLSATIGFQSLRQPVGFARQPSSPPPPAKPAFMSTDTSTPALFAAPAQSVNEKEADITEGMDAILPSTDSVEPELQPAKHMEPPADVAEPSIDCGWPSSSDIYSTNQTKEVEESEAESSWPITSQNSLATAPAPTVHTSVLSETSVDYSSASQHTLSEEATYSTTSAVSTNPSTTTAVDTAPAWGWLEVEAKRVQQRPAQHKPQKPRNHFTRAGLVGAAVVAVVGFLMLRTGVLQMGNQPVAATIDQDIVPEAAVEVDMMAPLEQGTIIMTETVEMVETVPVMMEQPEQAAEVMAESAETAAVALVDGVSGHIEQVQEADYAAEPSAANEALAAAAVMDDVATPSIDVHDMETQMETVSQVEPELVDIAEILAEYQVDISDASEPMLAMLELEPELPITGLAEKSNAAILEVSQAGKVAGGEVQEGGANVHEVPEVEEADAAVQDTYDAIQIELGEGEEEEGEEVVELPAMQQWWEEEENLIESPAHDEEGQSVAPDTAEQAVEELVVAEGSSTFKEMKHGTACSNRTRKRRVRYMSRRVIGGMSRRMWSESCRSGERLAALVLETVASATKTTAGATGRGLILRRGRARTTRSSLSKPPRSKSGERSRGSPRCREKGKLASP